MSIDERIEALTQSVELLAAIHKDNEARAAIRDERLVRLEVALFRGIAGFMEELDRGRAGE